MKCSWPLGNGDYLVFDVFDKNEGWHAVPGLYIFAYILSNGDWKAIYVGKTDDFSSRMPNHDRLNDAIKKGATHIHAKVVMSDYDRSLFERMLIQNLQPELNQNYK